jgi:hypothetical protein
VTRAIETLICFALAGAARWRRWSSSSSPFVESCSIAPTRFVLDHSRQIPKVVRGILTAPQPAGSMDRWRGRAGVYFCICASDFDTALATTELERRNLPSLPGDMLFPSLQVKLLVVRAKQRGEEVGGGILDGAGELVTASNGDVESSFAGGPSSNEAALQESLDQARAQIAELQRSHETMSRDLAVARSLTVPHLASPLTCTWPSIQGSITRLCTRR